jgi:hypothetical protein
MGTKKKGGLIPDLRIMKKGQILLFPHPAPAERAKNDWIFQPLALVNRDQFDCFLILPGGSGILLSGFSLICRVNHFLPLYLNYFQGCLMKDLRQCRD